MFLNISSAPSASPTFTPLMVPSASPSTNPLVFVQITSSNNHYYSITSDSNGVNVVVGSGNAGINYSRDGGSSWTRSAAPDSSAFQWRALASSSSGQFVVAGNINKNRGGACSNGWCSGDIWTSTDYGQNFVQRITYDTYPYHFLDFGSIAMSSNGNKFIAGVTRLGVILCTFNTVTGAISQIVPSITSVIVDGIIVSTITANAVSTDSSFTNLAFGIMDGIFYSSNSGMSWVYISVPSSVQQWNGITSSANGQYLAAIARTDIIYYSQDSGQKWNQSSSNFPSGLSITGVCSSVSGHIMAAAVYGSNIYISYDFGQSWQASDSISTLWHGVAVSDDGATIYGIVASGAIYKSTR